MFDHWLAQLFAGAHIPSIPSRLCAHTCICISRNTGTVEKSLWRIRVAYLLQCSLSGNTYIFVVLAINVQPRSSLPSESNAQEEEVAPTDTLIHRYCTQIEDLNKRLTEREQSAHADRSMRVT